MEARLVNGHLLKKVVEAMKDLIRSGKIVTLCHTLSHSVMTQAGHLGLRHLRPQAPVHGLGPRLFGLCQP